MLLAHPFYQPLGIFIRNATRGETNADATALVFVYSVLLMVIASITLWLIYGGGAGRILRVLAPRRKLRRAAPIEPSDQV